MGSSRSLAIREYVAYTKNFFFSFLFIFPSSHTLRLCREQNMQTILSMGQETNAELVAANVELRRKLERAREARRSAEAAEARAGELLAESRAEAQRVSELLAQERALLGDRWGTVESGLAAILATVESLASVEPLAPPQPAPRGGVAEDSDSGREDQRSIARHLRAPALPRKWGSDSEKENESPKLLFQVAPAQVPD